MAQLLHQLIQSPLRQTPDKAAFRFGQGTLTYQQLDIQSNQLANCLIEAGVKPGDRVGIYLNRCLETATAVYGILKSGAAFVPLDPGQPISRTKDLIDRCQMNVLISQKVQNRRLLKITTQQNQTKLVIGSQLDWQGDSISWDQLDKFSTNDPNISCTAKDLAYIIFSSGTTGIPKGIMHTHASGMAYAELSVGLYQANADDIIGNFCALHFDQSTFGYFSSMLAGATTVIISDALTKFPVSLLQMIEREKISIWYSVPLVMIQMLKSGALDQYDLSCLRWVKFGGEAFSAQQLAELMPHMPNAIFCNVYGPAEVNQCTYFHIREPFPNNQIIPLGYVWDDTDILIVDNNNAVVEAGEVGELLVSSTTMMRGYWDDEKLNSRAFFTVVGTDTKPKTYYRTGDLVCTSAGGDYPYGPNGEYLLYFMGRKDRQIKTRGYRVELAEVELAILSQEDIAEATVMALDNGEEGKLIKAFLVVKREIDINDLKKSLSSILPSYAIPSSWELLDSIPRTRNGKVDYQALTKVYI